MNCSIKSLEDKTKQIIHFEQKLQSLEREIMAKLGNFDMILGGLR